MTTPEILAITTASTVMLLLVILTKPTSGNRSRRYLHPELLIIATGTYYFILGPLSAIANDITRISHVELRYAMPLVIMAGVTGIVFTIIGTLCADIVIKGRKNPNIEPTISRELQSKILLFSGVAVLAIASVALTLWIKDKSIVEILIGTQTTTLNRDDFENRNHILGAMLNLFIPAYILLLTSQRIKNRYLILLGLFILLLYIFIGTRNKILFIVLSTLIVLALQGHIKIKPIRVGAFLLLVYVAFSIVAAYRVRYGGIDFSIDRSLLEVLTWGFRDSIYATLSFGTILTNVPSRFDFLYLEPIKAIPEYFVPRALWPNKPEISQQLAIISSTIGTGEALDIGLAAPIFSDLYLMFGWPTLIIGSATIGFIVKYFTHHTLPMHPNNLQIAIYSAFFPFVYYLISRGYFAQVLLDMTFIVASIPIAYSITSVVFRLRIR